MKTIRFTMALACLAAYANATIYEAEDATLSGTVTAESDSASGGAYVKLQSGSITFDVIADSAGMYDVDVYYSGYENYKIQYLYVNGTSVAQLEFDSTGLTFDNMVTTTVKLSSGSNTVAIIASWGCTYFDYIEVEKHVTEPFTLSDEPVTSGATTAARKLYSFLKENFGTKTISGVMTGKIDFEYDYDNFALTSYTDFKEQTDPATVYSKSGYYPALIGFDFLFATGLEGDTNHWYMGYTETAVNLANDLWNAGGIPAFTWHWKDPSDSVDAFYVSGAGTPYTTFDFTEGFVSGTTTWDTTSEIYQDIVEDIDHVASFFLSLQADSVACLFRPIHESGGAWFWWSTHTGEEFAALYQLMYNRMVNVDGVKNVVWVFNPQDASYTGWDPGSSYYDVLSVDIYNDYYDNQSNASDFNALVTSFGQSKILALSENGPIPDIDSMSVDGAIWSWWMPWYESWSGGHVSKTADSVWVSNMEDDRVISLGKMPGWANVNVATKTVVSASVVLSAQLQGKSLLVTTSVSGTADIALFNIQGAQAASLHKGSLSAGTHKFELGGLSQGVYVLRASGSLGAYMQTLVME
ncbi:MAG TPA: glycosyl hydrolase [Fibrobacteraceae bacterium]|nr:glycosyl hydrolase [Fibrobacteraceae bacterium]